MKVEFLGKVNEQFFIAIDEGKILLILELDQAQIEELMSVLKTACEEN